MEQGMTSRNRAVTLKRVVLIIAGINAGLLLSALAMSLIVSGGIDGGVGYVVGIVYTVLAIMIISRHPRHTVGWLFLTVGFFSAMTVFVFGFEAVTDNKSLQRIIPLMEWIGFWSWVPVFFIPISLVLQFFPDGRLPSRRWWPVTAVTVIGILGIAAALQFSPVP